MSGNTQIQNESLILAITRLLKNYAKHKLHFSTSEVISILLDIETVLIFITQSRGV